MGSSPEPLTEGNCAGGRDDGAFRRPVVIDESKGETRRRIAMKRVRASQQYTKRAFLAAIVVLTCAGRMQSARN